MAQKPSIPKGTRDFSPIEMARRNYIFNTIKDVFMLYGFQQIETPAVENLSTLMGKYGEEGDKLLFKILNSGDYLKDAPDDLLAAHDSLHLTTKISEKGLRYDLTVPFARYVVQHRNELQMPFRRYQVQPVWRADRPQKGRYREFYQCDADIVGSDSLLNEVELVMMIDEVFKRFNINVAIKLNNRKILSGIAEVIGAADKIVNTAESGLFGFISMASFVWIVISLMLTVRRVFNNVWKVNRERNMLGMIGVIVGITILAPFVVIIFFSGTVVYSNFLELLFPSQMFSAHLKSFVSWLSFAIISILVMSIMYKYIPGTRVRFRYAIKAAGISGLAFTVVQYLYLETQMIVAKQSAIYGVLAALPLFMIWLNLGWTIILYGAELSYAFQNVEKHRISIETLNEMNEEAVRTRKERIQKGMKQI